MISFNMNRKMWILSIIIGFTILGFIIVLLLSGHSRYNKYVVSDSKWEKIQSTRKNDNTLSFDKLSFNDYNLVLDQSSDTLYYPIVDSARKYNPTVQFIANSEKSKIVFHDKLSEDGMIEMMVYNDTSYHIYSIQITKNPIIKIDITNSNSNRKWNSVDVNILDNHPDAFQKVIKSRGELMILEENEEYHVLLRKESVGRNERKNDISIFGMDREDEYILKKNSSSFNKVELFIDDEYMGTYSLEHKGERRMKNNE